jgi:L-threonylcarbamoyladenylate synthase
MPRRLPPQALDEAAAALRAGHPVAIPTETVYGLAADAWQPDAVAAVFAAKGRPSSDPLIVHISPGLLGGRGVAAGLEALGLIAHGADPRIDTLAAAFWPGPLTLVLPRGPRVTDAITAGLPDVAVRMPAHPTALDLIDRTGRPLVAPSANRFGRISPTTAEAVVAELEGRVGLVLDGGPCAVGVESTVLRLADRLLLRPGLITAADLAPFLGAPPTSATGTTAGPQPAPGMLASHYAPRTPLVLAPPATLEAARQRGGRLGWLGWSRGADADVVEVLSPNGDPAEAARRLYAALRALDAAGCALLVAERPPGTDGLSLAIADRLRRAAAGTPPLSLP